MDRGRREISNLASKLPYLTINKEMLVECSSTVWNAFHAGFINIVVNLPTGQEKTIDMHNGVWLHDSCQDRMYKQGCMLWFHQRKWGCHIVADFRVSDRRVGNFKCMQMPNHELLRCGVKGWVGRQSLVCLYSCNHHRWYWQKHYFSGYCVWRRLTVRGVMTRRGEAPRYS